VTAQKPRELVVLVNEEFVGEHGPVKVVWHVRHNDGFVSASESPGARSERLKAGPRVVWRSRVEVELTRGTTVIRVETRSGAARGSTLAHLTGVAKSSRPSVVRTRFVVGPRGALVPEERPTGRTK
jgi:hypothetical protein